MQGGAWRSNKEGSCCDSENLSSEHKPILPSAEASSVTTASAGTAPPSVGEFERRVGRQRLLRRTRQNEAEVVVAGGRRRGCAATGGGVRGRSRTRARRAGARRTR